MRARQGAQILPAMAPSRPGSLSVPSRPSPTRKGRRSGPFHAQCLLAPQRGPPMGESGPGRYPSRGNRRTRGSGRRRAGTSDSLAL